MAAVQFLPLKAGKICFSIFQKRYKGFIVSTGQQKDGYPVFMNPIADGAICRRVKAGIRKTVDIYQFYVLNKSGFDFRRDIIKDQEGNSTKTSADSYTNGSYHLLRKI